MAVTQRSTVVYAFADRLHAEQAVEELQRHGFREDQITVMVHRHDPGTVEVTDMDAAKAAQVTGRSKAEEGAAAGAGVGAVFGGLAAVAAGLLPGVGPVLSVGTLAAAALGMAAGAAGGGLVGALIGLDFPEEEARFFERELKAGRVVVGVQAKERYSEAAEILERFGGYDRGGPRTSGGADPSPEGGLA